MKKKLQLFCKTIIFLILLGAGLFAAAMITERKASYIKNADFFEEAKEGHLDVLFLGSSHVINGINPITLYENYGITSYNLGGHGSIMSETYWQLLRSLDYCKPEYVVVDCYMLEKNYQYLDVCDESSSSDEIKESIEHLHLNMDAFPLSKLKIAAIRDLIQDKDIQNEFLFDFILYHNRWNELQAEDFIEFGSQVSANRLMGAEMRYGVKTDVDVYEKCEDGQVFDEQTVCMNYLTKIIETCADEDIGLLLTYLPFSAETKDQIAANTAGRIAEEYGVPYINMATSELVIDEAADLNDHGHLNASGAYKVTNVIGNWLSENAALADHRGEAGYEKWEERCGEFDSEIESVILNGEDLRTELSLLTNTNISSVIYVNTESTAFNDSGIMNLISNISGTDKILEAAASMGPYILIDDKGTGNKYEACGAEVLEAVSTSMGELTYIPVEKNFRLLYPVSDESINYLYDDNHLKEDIQILLYDSSNGELIRHIYYAPVLQDYEVSYQ